MSFFIGPMRQHLDGHKDLTAHNEIKTYVADTVSIPLVQGAAPISCLVKEGDKVKIGDKIAMNDRFGVPIFASVSGTVTGIVKKMAANLKPADHVVIENDHKDTKAEPKYLAEDASKEEIINYMKEMGLLGQGGAGFPSFIKFNTDKCESLIINAVECEPYITADARNMEENMEYLRTGVVLGMKASGAKKGYLCIKEYKKEVISKCIELLKDVKDVEVKPVPDVYPMGWERTLVYEVTKKRYEKLPIEVNCVVSNVTSLIEIAKSSKLGTPIYEKFVTVSGNAVKEPHNVKCRVGTSFKELIDVCGGYVEGVDKISLIAGGPMMGSSIVKNEVCTSSISNCVLVNKYEEFEAIKCLRCGACVDHCPSGLQPVNIANAAKANDFDRLAKLKAVDCVECGMCTYVCPSKIEVTENVRRAKRTMMARAKK